MSVGKLVWIWENGRFGKFTVECIIDDMLEKGIIKINPITLDKRTFRKKKTIFGQAQRAGQHVVWAGCGPERKHIFS